MRMNKQSSTIRINEPILVKQKNEKCKYNRHKKALIVLDYYFLKKVADHIAKTIRCVDCGERLSGIIHSTEFKPQKVELEEGCSLTIEYKLKIDMKGMGNETTKK